MTKVELIFENIKTWLLLLAMMFAVYSWPIRVFTGSKVAYFMMGLFLVMFMLSTVQKEGSFLFYLSTAQKEGSSLLYIYITAVVIVGLLQFVILGGGKYFWMAMVSYLVIPIICGRYVITPEQFDRLLLIFSFVAIPNFIGLIAQMYGYDSKLFVDEQTMTASEIHVRYNSVLGGSWALALVSIITALSGAYWLFVKQRFRIYNGMVFVLSLVCIYFSYARRGYIVVVVGLIIILWGLYQQKHQFHKMLYMAPILVGFALFLMMTFSDVGTVVSRGASIFDFYDPSNLLRVIRWANAIDTTLENPFIGIGFGKSGTMGRDPAFVDMGDVDYLAAESYYLQIAMEGGIVLGIIFILTLFYTAFTSMKLLRQDKRLLLSWAIMICFMIESLTGGSIGGPHTAIVFWLAFGLNSKQCGKESKFTTVLFSRDGAS